MMAAKMEQKCLDQVAGRLARARSNRSRRMRKLHRGENVAKQPPPGSIPD